MDDIEELRKALRYAIGIIENYQLDIRDSRRRVGVDLLAKGFCQGVIYLEALPKLRHVLKETAQSGAI